MTWSYSFVILHLVLKVLVVSSIFSLNPVTDVSLD